MTLKNGLKSDKGFRKAIPQIAFLSIIPAVIGSGAFNKFFEGLIALFSIYAIGLFLGSLQKKRVYILPPGMFRIRKIQVQFARSFAVFTSFFLAGISIGNPFIITGGIVLLLDWCRPILQHIRKPATNHSI